MNERLLTDAFLFAGLAASVLFATLWLRDRVKLRRLGPLIAAGTELEMLEAEISQRHEKLLCLEEELLTRQKQADARWQRQQETYRHKLQALKQELATQRETAEREVQAKRDKLRWEYKQHHRRLEKLEREAARRGAPKAGPVQDWGRHGEKT